MRQVNTELLFWPLKRFEGISRPEAGGGQHKDEGRLKLLHKHTHEQSADILMLLKNHSNKHTHTYTQEDVLCGRSSDYSQKTYCELPGGDVCVLICSALLEGQGSGTVGIFTSMLQWMALSDVIYNHQMQNKLGILYRHSVHKTVCFLCEKKNPQREWVTGRGLADLAVLDTQQNWPLRISTDFLSLLWSVYRWELMRVVVSALTGKLCRRRSEWFPRAPSTACSTSGNCKYVSVVHVYSLMWNIMNWGGQNTQDMHHPNRVRRRIYGQVSLSISLYPDLVSCLQIKEGI